MRVLLDSGAWGGASSGHAALAEGGEKIAAAARLCELQVRVWELSYQEFIYLFIYFLAGNPLTRGRLFVFKLVVQDMRCLMD